MQRFRHVLVGIVVSMALSGCDDMMVRVDDLIEANLAPTQAETVGGLKDALNQGVDAAVRELGRSDGFNANTLVHIGVPESLKDLETGLRRIGKGRYVDEFELTLNRAAEQAVPKAASILGEAVRRMTLEDAVGILKGPDDAVTAYFRRSSEQALSSAFLPIVSAQTERAGVSGAYKRMLERAGFLGSFLSPEARDIDAYITAQALEGLFTYIAIEEKAIRERPLERGTALMRKVFGYYTSS